MISGAGRGNRRLGFAKKIKCALVVIDLGKIMVWTQVLMGRDNKGPSGLCGRDGKKRVECYKGPLNPGLMLG